ncbi:tetratricopeptide repeat protein [Bacillaceae bacterium SIJ1]|uniref:glycosyltransferase family 2 protein n=1 Tax=Litoribacterium kuwaitense TaxID=1398745 RepID=UPI0013EE102A|nr:glycosyltransferase family 2 protein [Litoribacterium kuwaitense]NGP45182.1 tetratricopeptide repeat protein [Litoribacterium kuwaitense]
MGVSVCILTKNDGLSLVRCLHSVVDVADEIILIDSGSSFATKRIADRFGAKVYHYPHEAFSFRKARNLAIDYATEDWILFLDSDEALSHESRARLPNLLKNRQQSYAFLIQNYYPNGRWSSFPVTRLFPNRNDIRYEKDIHETVNYSLSRVGMMPVISYIYVHHFGYLEQETHLRTKNEAYFQRLQDELRSSPDDAATWWYTALAYMVAGERAKAFQAIDHAISLDPDNKIPLTFKARFQLGSGQYTEALETLTKGLNLSTQPFWNPTLYNVLGMIYMKLNRVDEAIHHLETALEEEAHFAHLWMNVSIAYQKADHREKALDAVLQAVDLNPYLLYLTPLTRAQSHLYAFQEDVAGAYEHVTTLLKV